MTVTLSGEPFIAYVLAGIRILAWLAIVPPFSSRAVPIVAKVLLSVGLAFALTPSLHLPAVPADAVELASFAVQEALIGATMGFVTYLVFAAVQAAGDLIDVFGGFSLAMAFDPLSLHNNSVFGKLYQMLAMMLLFATDAHLIVIGGLLHTFKTMPVGSVWQAADVNQVVTVAFGIFFTSAVQIALPLVGVLFLADLGLALLTKVAPQLNAIGIMFPAKIALTLTVVGLSFPVLPRVIDRLVETAVQAMGAVG